MIKRNQRYFNWINRLSDVAIIFAAFYFAVWFWVFAKNHDVNNIAVMIAQRYPTLILLSAFVCMVIMQSIGVYDSHRTERLVSELIQLIKAFALFIGVGISALYLLKLRDFSRGVMLFFVLFSVAALCFKRCVVKLSLLNARRRGYNKKHVVIFGEDKLAEKYCQNISDNPQLGYCVIGFVGERDNPIIGKRLGDYAEFDELLAFYEPDEVIIALEQDQINLTQIVIAACEEHGVRASIIPVFSDYLPACATVDSVGNVRLINMRAIALDIGFNSAVKRIMDIVVSLTAIIILSPVMLIIAIAIKLTSKGPVIFKQPRVGKEHKEFYMYKFRSMVVNDTETTAWSKDRDSRVTPVGAFIRKFSLDELPQLFNVLKNDMSIVGPRPELRHFVQEYKYSVPRYMVKHQVKPGITGWAQVNGYRGDTSIEKRIEYDIWYIENWSLILDIKIMLATVFGGMMNAEKNLSRPKAAPESEKEESRV